jgi:hypothetical protein
LKAFLFLPPVVFIFPDCSSGHFSVDFSENMHDKEKNDESNGPWLHVTARCLLLTSPFAVGLRLASDVDSSGAGTWQQQLNRPLPYWCCGIRGTRPTGSRQTHLPDTDNNIPWSWEGASLSNCYFQNSLTIAFY